jgi:hypothetical protein
VLILGLDLGTSTGWAVADGPRVTRSGVWRLPPADPSAAYAALRDCLEYELSEMPVPGLVAYEAVPASAHRGGDAAHRWGGFEAIVLAECEARQVRYLGVPIATWKRAAGLRSGTGPAEALAAAHRRWPVPHFETADEAVARWVAIAAAERVK